MPNNFNKLRMKIIRRLLLSVIMLAVAINCNIAQASAADEYDYFESSIVVGEAAIDYNLFFDNPTIAIEVMNEEFSKGAETIYLFVYGQHTEYYDLFTGDSIPRSVVKDQITYLVDASGNTIPVGPGPDQPAPTGLTGVAPTNEANNDGKITGVNDTMEYRLKGETEFTPVPAGTHEITDLAPGTYEVRYQATTELGAGEIAEVEIPAYVYDRIPDIVAEMQQIYPYIDSTEKQYIRDVRNGINEMDDQTWDNIIANLLTDEVESRFTAAGKDAGTEMRAFVKALGDIYYSSEATELESTLRGFKDQFKGSFQVLFGKEVSVEDLYQLLVAFKDELPNVIEGNTQYMDKLAFGSNSELVDTVPEVMKDAIRAAIQAPEFTKLNGKLSEIGWNAELLITERINLANEVDSNRNAELALGKALIRSESKLVGVGSTEVYAAQGETITLTDSAKKLYKLVIMDKNATGLVDWVVLQDDIEFGTRIDANNGEINHPVANIKDNNGTLEITPNAAGEIVLVAVRGVGGGSVIDDWVLKLHIIATE